MARSGQAAVALNRPGLVLSGPKRGNSKQGIIGHAAAHRPRIRPCRILAEQLGNTNRFGRQTGSQTIIGPGGNKVYHCIETHGRGANPSFRTHGRGANPFSSSYRSGRDSCCCDIYLIRATDHSGDKFQNINNNKTHTNTNKILPLT